MKKYLFLAAILTISTSIMAQKPDNTKTQSSGSADSLLNSLSTDDKDAPVVIFKSSRMILSQLPGFYFIPKNSNYYSCFIILQEKS